ncbi:hypothetical protein RI367_005368 [Sorochytrium milnesiophthora]
MPLAAAPSASAAAAAALTTFSVDDAVTARKRESALAAFDQWAAKAKHLLSAQRMEYEVSMRNQHENIAMQTDNLEDMASSKATWDAGQNAQKAALQVQDNKLAQTRQHHQAVLEQQRAARQELEQIRAQVQEKKHVLRRQQEKRAALVNHILQEVRLYEAMSGLRITPRPSGAVFTFTHIDPSDAAEEYSITAVLTELDIATLSASDFDMALQSAASKSPAPPLHAANQHMHLMQFVDAQPALPNTAIAAINKELMRTEDLFAALKQVRRAFMQLARGGAA